MQLQIDVFPQAKWDLIAHYRFIICPIEVTLVCIIIENTGSIIASKFASKIVLYAQL